MVREAGIPERINRTSLGMMMAQDPPARRIPVVVVGRARWPVVLTTWKIHAVEWEEFCACQIVRGAVFKPCRDSSQIRACARIHS